MTQLAVCIVNWNTREHLRRCLDSLRLHAADLAPAIVVVDNGSADGSAAMVAAEYPEVQLVANPDNRGYAAGNNQALRAVEAEFKLLLNPDVQVTPGSIQYLVEFLRSHPAAGAVSPRLRYPDGRVQLTCRTFPTPDVVLYDALLLAKLFPQSPTFGKYRMSWWAHDDEREVDQPMASAFLLRDAALQEVGLFDEAFPIFFNDVDLCYRLKQAGWEVWFTARVEMTHFHGASTSQVWGSMLRESHQAFGLFYRKHYRQRLAPVVYWGTLGLLSLGFGVRRLISRLRPSGPHRVARS
jgi:GT2 family glycosyltransferase